MRAVSGRRLRVLLVDDDPAMRRLVAHWLTKAGHEVEEAEDGCQALEAIQSRCPDLLVTDWEMPRMDGLELCHRVRELSLPHRVYILFLTVRSGSDALVRGIEVGADEFLSKPVNREELIARIRAAGRIVELERRLGELVRTDLLTGVMTRRSFFPIFEKEWHRSQRIGLPLSCVMLDLDFFKQVNDNHGHQAGDAVLRVVGEFFQEACRGSDTVCRYGGEEFCILLPETSEQDAAVWAERVRRGLAERVIPVGTESLRVTLSVGVAERHDDTQSVEQLIDLADQALLCAKQSGRDRVVRFSETCELGDAELCDPTEMQQLLARFKAGDVMTPTIVCLRKDQSIGRAAEFFLRSRINSTPIVDQQGKLVGMLSEKDLMGALASLSSWHRPIGEVMKRNVICYDEDTPIRKIYEFLCRVTIRRVVVVRDERPTGTISRGTLLRWFRNLVCTAGLVNLDPGECESSTAADVPLATHVAQTAQELTTEAGRLLHGAQDDEELTACLVGAATRIQELVNDLLAHAHQEHGTDGRASMLQLWALTSETKA